MPHHVYQTHALILRGVNSGDSNRFIDVFTREIGLVRAAAQSARRERSKLRYSLQDYTVAEVSLVRGRDVWRITGAKEEWSAYHALRTDPKKLILFGRVASLISRLLTGEEKNEDLFDAVSSCTSYLRGTALTDGALKGVEYIIVCRILHHLGYLSTPHAFLRTTSFSKEDIDAVLASEKEIVREINHALKESQL